MGPPHCLSAASEHDGHSHPCLLDYLFFQIGRFGDDSGSINVEFPFFEQFFDNVSYYFCPFYHNFVFNSVVLRFESHTVYCCLFIGSHDTQYSTCRELYFVYLMGHLGLVGARAG